MYIFVHVCVCETRGDRPTQAQIYLKKLWSEWERLLNTEQELQARFTRNSSVQLPPSHAHNTPPHVHKWTCIRLHTQVINPTKWICTHLHRDVSTQNSDSIRGAASRCLSAGENRPSASSSGHQSATSFHSLFIGSAQLHSGPFVLLSQVVSDGKRGSAFVLFVWRPSVLVHAKSLF